MKKTRITLKDLAAELKLAPSTISRALDNHPAISKATKKRVQEKADELGFVPNSIASSFRKKRTKSIGVIVPRIDVHFHSLAISGMEEHAYSKGYNVTIFQSNNLLEREEEIAKILQNKMVEGIIACIAVETENYHHFKKFQKLGVPVVFYDRVPSNFDANKIVINDFESAFKATEHLIKMGCKRIGHIAGNQSTNIFKRRVEGYKAALDQYNLCTDDELISYTKELNYEEGIEASKYFLQLSEQPDGIFCANDYTAVSAIQVFQKNHIKVPDDIAIVGFSNYPISKVIEPHITTINDQAFLMGCTAAKLLIRIIEDEDDFSTNTQSITLKTELIVRESSLKNNNL